MGAQEKCELIGRVEDLEKRIKEKDRLFVLFYASWCPFSQRFLPEFLDSAGQREECHVRVIVDDKDELIDRYQIEVYPTVLYFEKGQLERRLDGTSHVGLTGEQLQDFIEVCVRK